MTSTRNRHIDENVRIHDRIATAYDSSHGEIFNEIEQSRLHDALDRAAREVQTGAAAPRAFDFGCGSGNLTRHLLDLGFEVTAADVSERFLALVAQQFAGRPVVTRRINGEDLAGVADAAFDLTASYSVLHHVPDYLAAVEELARITKPGGIIVIDHEHSPRYWEDDPVRREFLRRASIGNWRKFLVPRNYYGKLRRLLIDPHYANEGDIHVWPDDHIEWERIACTLGAVGCETLFEEDYLVFRTSYRREVYEAYRDRCSDARLAVFRKRG